MSKPNILNNIGVSIFRNVFNQSFSWTGFYSKRKIIEGTLLSLTVGGGRAKCTRGEIIKIS